MISTIAADHEVHLYVAGHRSVSVSGSDEVGRMGDARSHHFADAVTTYPIKQLSPEVIHDPRVPAIGTTNQDVWRFHYKT